MNHFRFFIDKRFFLNNKVLITDKDLIHQIKDVLRLKIDDQIIVLDNSGFEYLINIKKINQQVEGLIIKKQKNQNEPIKKIILIQTLLKQDRFEQVLKFCTNIGVSEFLPVVTERCLIKEISSNKQIRYQKIIQESAEQSHRGILPKLNDPTTLKELEKNIDKESLKLVAWEQEQKTEINNFQPEIKKANKIYLFIGPEGGLTEEEVGWLKKNDFLVFSLGKLILRAEIAGLVASSLILNT